MNNAVEGLGFSTYSVAATLFLAAVALLIVVYVRRISWTKAASGSFIYGAVLVVVIEPVLQRLGLFAVADYFYGLWFVTPAAVLVAFGVSRIRNAKRLTFGIPLILLALIPSALGIYATNVEPKRLEVNRFVVPALVGTPISIGVIADIQSPSVGEHEKTAVQALSAQQTDLVLVAGDSYSDHEDPLSRYFDDFRDLLAGLSAANGVVFVEGDNDSDGRLPGLVQASGHEILRNQVVVKEIKGQRIAILGVENDYESVAAVAAMSAFSGVDADYRILLAHHPDVVNSVAPGVDLVVAGHTHGGQVSVPFFGPPIIRADIPRDHGAGGIFRYPTTQLFVTRGVGVTHGGAPPLRFNAVPEVNVLVLSPPK